MKKFTTTAPSVTDKKVRIVGGFASGGGIRPGEVAVDIFGKEMNGAHLFAYMFRRFGFPNCGSDDYKNLCSYFLTTPMPGLYLLVTPYMGKSENTELHWGVRFDKRVQDAYDHWESRHWRRYKKILKRWSEKNLVVGKLEPGEKREVLHEFENGFVLVLRRPTDRHLKRFRLTEKELGAWSIVFNDIYDKFHPERKKRRAKRAAKLAAAGYPRTPWHKRRDFGYKIHRALHTAMLDLKTPTHVRDIAFNAIDQGDHLWPDDENVKLAYYEHAGYAGQPTLK